MLARLRTRIARAIAPQRTRRFDAAAGGRRGFGTGTFGPINAETGAAPLVRMRARYLAANNQWLANAVGNWTAALVGTGIRPTSATPDAVATWDDWNPMADADGRTDFDGLQAVIARALVVDGESFVHLMHGDDGLTVRVLPAEQVDESLTRERGDGRHIVQGVEFDGEGRRLAYHVLPQRPDQFASYAPPVRVDAADMLHVMRPLAAGQVRGVSWLAPIVLPASELDKLTDALLMGASVAAMHAGFLVDQNGTASGSLYDGPQAGSILESGIEPGTLKVLPSGVDVKFNTPQAAQQTSELVKHSLRGLAAGLGLPSHMLDGDLTGANYSSLRAGLLPFRQRVEQVQYGVLVPQLLAPLWRRLMALDGDPAARAEWIMPAWQQVDPQKAVEADLAEISAGLKSRRQAVAERGWSVEQLDRDIAADREREAALGIGLGSPQPTKLENPPRGEESDDA